MWDYETFRINFITTIQPKCCSVHHSLYTILVECEFLVWKNFYSNIEKNSAKKTNERKKYTIITQKKYIYMTMYNYKLYTIARLEPNKSIQAVQLLYGCI